MNDIWHSQLLKIDSSDGSVSVFADFPDQRDFEGTAFSPFPEEFGNYLYQVSAFPHNASAIFRIDASGSVEYFIPRGGISHPATLLFPQHG